MTVAVAHAVVHLGMMRPPGTTIPPPPDVIAGWPISDVISEGGTAIAYATTFEGSPAVLKVVKAGLKSGPHGAELNARFEREAEILGKLAGKRAPKLYGSGDDGGSAYIVMERLQGELLSTHTKSPAPLPVALRLIRALLDALVDFHAEELSHRDLKPANIVVAADGSIKLIDFGFSSFPGATPLTMIGEVRGTPGYMAPEQLLGLPSDIGPHSDQWAVGAILHFLLLGKLHYEGSLEDMVGKARVAYNSESDSPHLEMLRDARSRLPAGVYAILMRALQPRPARRFESVADMREQIDILRKEHFDWNFIRSSCTNCGKAVVSGDRHECPAADCAPFLCIACTTCQRYYLALIDPQPLLRVPLAQELIFCPTCGREPRPPRERRVQQRGLAACSRGHARYSQDDYCIRDGHHLLPTIVTHDAVRMRDADALVFAGGSLTLSFPDLAYDAVLWPITDSAGAPIDWTPVSRASSALRPERRFSVPRHDTWGEWSVFVGSHELKFVIAPAPSAQMLMSGASAPLSAEPAHVRLSLPADPAFEEHRAEAKARARATLGSTPLECLAPGLFRLPAARLQNRIPTLTVLPWNVLVQAVPDATVPPPMPQTKRQHAPPPTGDASKVLQDRIQCVVVRPGCPFDLPLEEGAVMELKTSSEGSVSVGLALTARGVTGSAPRLKASLGQLKLGEERREDGAAVSEYTLELPRVREPVLIAIQCGSVEWQLRVTPESPPRPSLTGSNVECVDAERGIYIRRTPGAIDWADPSGESFAEVLESEVCVFYPGFLEPIRVPVTVVPFDHHYSANVLSGKSLAALEYAGEQRDIGVKAFPITMKGIPTTVSVEFTGDAQFPVELAASTEVVRQGSHRDVVARVRTCDGHPFKVRAGVRVDLQWIPDTVCARPENWEAHFPVLRPQPPPGVNPSVRVTLHVKGVHSPNTPEHIFYDFGTSFTAISTRFGTTENLLREARFEFVRSRALVLCKLDGEPYELRAPFTDADAAPAQDTGFTVMLEEIKTRFNLDRDYLLHDSEKGDATIPIRWTYEHAQRAIARHVIQALRVFPKRVATAFPVTFRGAERDRAIAAIEEAFTHASRSVFPEHRRVVVDATLDESTAAAVPTLLNMLDNGRSGRVAVIDIGGGTTDITVYQVTKSGPELDVRCVGFDGMCVGGRWVTRVVVDLLARALRDVCGISIQLPSPGCKGVGSVDSNWQNLKRVAEVIKLKLHANQSLTLGEIVAIVEEQRNFGYSTELSVLSELLHTNQTERSTIILEAQQLYGDPRYRTFISDVVMRARNAENLDLGGGGEWPREFTHVVLTGQASYCKRLLAAVEEEFGTTPKCQPSAERRKRAVTDGLQAYARAILDGKRLRVGGLQRTVLGPVGEFRGGAWRAVLPRMHPICVPASLRAGAEVTGLIDLPAIDPRVRLWANPDGERACTDNPAALPSFFHDDFGPIMGGPDPSYARFRYDLWVNEADELRGALYVQVEEGEWTRRYREHPALDAFACLGRCPDQVLISHIGTDTSVGAGTGWSMTRVEGVVAARPPFSFTQYLGPPGLGFVIAAELDLPGGGSQYIAVGYVPRAHPPQQPAVITNRDLALGWAESLVRRYFRGLPTICGVQLSPGRVVVAFCPDEGEQREDSEQQVEMKELGSAAPMVVVITYDQEKPRYEFWFPAREAAQYLPAGSELSKELLDGLRPHLFDLYRLELRRDWSTQRFDYSEWPNVVVATGHRTLDPISRP